jgi:hypothetical protein
VKNFIKYTILTVAGLAASYIFHQAASQTRGQAGIGGEIVFALLPILWWLIERLIKDIRGKLDE